MLSKPLCQQVAQLAYPLHHLRVPRIAAVNELVSEVERLYLDAFEQEHFKPKNISLVAGLVVKKMIVLNQVVLSLPVQQYLH